MVEDQPDVVITYFIFSELVPPVHFSLMKKTPVKNIRLAIEVGASEGQETLYVLLYRKGPQEIIQFNILH